MYANVILLDELEIATLFFLQMLIKKRKNFYFDPLKRDCYFIKMLNNKCVIYTH